MIRFVLQLGSQFFHPAFVQLGHFSDVIFFHHLGFTMIGFIVKISFECSHKQESGLQEDIKSSASFRCWVKKWRSLGPGYVKFNCGKRCTDWHSGLQRFIGEQIIEPREGAGTLSILSTLNQHTLLLLMGSEKHLVTIATALWPEWA